MFVGPELLRAEDFEPSGEENDPSAILMMTGMPLGIVTLIISVVCAFLFFGPKGLKFGEIGARPAGEKIWDMYRVGSEFDVYREWALAITGQDLQLLAAPACPKGVRRLAAVL